MDYELREQSFMIKSCLSETILYLLIPAKTLKLYKHSEYFPLSYSHFGDSGKYTTIIKEQIKL